MSKKLGVIAGVAALSVASAAGATEFRFDGGAGGAAFDSPTGNIALDCGTVGSDFCSNNDALGFDYSKDGVSFNVTAYAGGSLAGESFTRGGASELIQDLVGPNQGLGVLSEGGNTQDQINFDTGESILFTFTEEVTISGIFLNSGTSGNCPDLGSPEGPCGAVGVLVDGVLNSLTDFLAGGLLADGGAAATFVGRTFEFISLTSGAGYSIERLSVNEVPIPGALPLLVSGIAGLGFASRKKKKASA